LILALAPRTRVRRRTATTWCDRHFVLALRRGAELSSGSAQREPRRPRCDRLRGRV